MTEEKRASELTAERDEDRLLEHEYDGIREYDNPMPRWWVRIFWGTFFFSLLYVLHFDFGRGLSIEESYTAEMEVVNAKRAQEALAQAASEETLSTMLADTSTVSQGKGVFAKRCAACHADEGQGNIGPNLTDDHWLHGSQLMDIYKTVSDGVPEKGMPAWVRQLTPTELRQAVVFVASLRGKNLPGKAPEGTVTASSP